MDASRSLASVHQEISFPQRSGWGKREDDGNGFSWVLLKIICAQSQRRQKMTEVNNCFFIYGFYFHVKR